MSTQEQASHPRTPWDGTTPISGIYVGIDDDLGINIQQTDGTIVVLDADELHPSLFAEFIAGIVKPGDELVTYERRCPANGWDGYGDDCQMIHYWIGKMSAEDMSDEELLDAQRRRMILSRQQADRIYRAALAEARDGGNGEQAYRRLANSPGRVA